jgi:2-polyprenyl-3-methyl-5-hydroxy-6-metoxy-1,4-benzoquinol methylase
MNVPERYPETADIETSTDDYASRFAGRVGEWMLQVQERAVLRMLAPFPNASVLDVGGGHGQLTEALVRNGHRVTVLSSSEECRERIRPFVDSGQVGFEVGNVLEMPYPDRAFDVVLSLRLLAHVNRWEEFLAEMARVADRAVILDYPEVRSINYLGPHLFRLKKRLEGNTREYACFREAQLLNVFDVAGFRRSDCIRQFFLPMVLHRVLRQPRISASLEACFRLTGLTGFLGSPVILKVERR